MQGWAVGMKQHYNKMAYQKDFVYEGVDMAEQFGQTS